MYQSLEILEKTFLVYEIYNIFIKKERKNTSKDIKIREKKI